MKRSQPAVTERSFTDPEATERAPGERRPSSPQRTPIPPRSRSATGLAKIRKAVGATSLRRGIIGTAVFIGLWLVVSGLDGWVGHSLPIVPRLPRLR